MQPDLDETTEKGEGESDDRWKDAVVGNEDAGMEPAREML